jgi:thioredoxin 1
MVTGVMDVTDADFEAEAIGAELPVLVEFTADWCPPCRQMGPVFEALAAEEGDRLTVVQLEVSDVL